MSKTPSTILSDALASFNRAATLAFTAAQDQARKDVTQATTDAREARRERDEAVSALHAAGLEEQAWKQEAAVWKTAANQAELTIDHHLETIAQLRQEATQWKNQCLRLEETSRQEAVSWKEQFLRVEQERSKLAQRVEELVTEQLGSNGHAQISAMPYTPMARYSVMDDLTASTRWQRVSALNSLTPAVRELSPSKPASSISKIASSTKGTRQEPILQLPTPLSENQRSTRHRAAQEAVSSASQPGSSSNGTRQILVRRVQAVVEVPVKEESVERDGVGPDTRILTSPSGITSTSTSASISVPAPKVRKVLSRCTELSTTTPHIRRRASTKRTYVEVGGEESERDGASQYSRQSDAEYQPVSEDDDELLMGVETNRKEVYGMKRVPKRSPCLKSARPLVAARKRKAHQPIKKSRPSTSSMP